MVKNRCVIVGASPAANAEFIEKMIQQSDFVICADGGRDIIAKTSITPDLIIGDMDSSSDTKVFESIPTKILPVIKDDTDTMYCVKTALSMGFERFLLLGTIGGRMDHTLANLSVLLYLRNHNAEGAIISEYEEITLLDSGVNVISDVKGKTISVMPFACERIKLSYNGLFYPLKEAAVTAEYPYTISNKAVENEIEITVHEGKALLIINKELFINNF